MTEPTECPRCHRRHTVRIGARLTICPTCDSPPGLNRGPSEARAREYLFGRRLPAISRITVTAVSSGIEVRDA